MIIDILWWTNTNFKKAEKGMEAHEHYHIGIEMAILGVALEYFSIDFSSFLYGGGLMFIVAEWLQRFEIISKKVVPGHPFAYGSTHFKSSTAIGIILVIVLICSFILLGN